MARVLSLMYEDILNFHRRALFFFQKTKWRQIFDATWKSYKMEFTSLIDVMSRHQGLIESQANLSQIRDFQDFRRETGKRFQAQVEHENFTKLHALYSWLRHTDIETDQHNYSVLRAKYPGTGRWLLDNTTFMEWFNLQYPTIPPLLWICGMPGAGKTILTSLIIEEVQKIKPKPTVLFFYCKNGRPDRDNFHAIARSFLAQFIQQDKDLVQHFYKECYDHGEPVLTKPSEVERLLAFAFENCKSVYIILDGLDECERENRKSIVGWFRNLVENLPPSEPERFRCLFVSQDDGYARKDFEGLARIKVEVEDNKGDIEKYCQAESGSLQQKFELTDEEISSITTRVTESAGGICCPRVIYMPIFQVLGYIIFSLTRITGMFLLANLIWKNLMGQTDKKRLERELQPSIFPKGTNKA
jgi:hypothetical protein